MEEGCTIAPANSCSSDWEGRTWQLAKGMCSEDTSLEGKLLPLVASNHWDTGEKNTSLASTEPTDAKQSRERIFIAIQHMECGCRFPVMYQLERWRSYPPDVPWCATFLIGDFAYPSQTKTMVFPGYDHSVPRVYNREAIAWAVQFLPVSGPSLFSGRICQPWACLAVLVEQGGNLVLLHRRGDVAHEEVVADLDAILHLKGDHQVALHLEALAARVWKWRKQLGCFLLPCSKFNF